MRILFITPLFSPQTGGAATHFSIITDYLKQKKEIDKIVILTRFSSKANAILKKDKILILRALPFTKKADLLVSDEDVKFFDVLLKYANVFIVNVVIMCLVAFLCLVFKIDILHYHRKGIYPAISLLTKLKILGRTRIILDCQDMSEKLPRPETYDKVVYPCKSIHRLLKSRNVPENKLHYIPLPFELASSKIGKEYVERVRRCYSIGQEYILFVGDVTKYKGIYELTEAFDNLRNADSNFCKLLVIAGDNKEGDNFLRKIKGKSHIIYIGPVEHETALALIRGSKLVILPSKTEGLPRVCLESIALESRVIYPAGIPEFGELDPKHVLDDISVKAIEKKIREVVNIKSFRGYHLEAHYPENSVEALFSLYEELLA